MAALDNPANAALMRSFCSLGHNCEFGVAQEKCGANPIDLLRWADSKYPALMHMLKDRFEGIGDDLRLQRHNTEFFIESPRYGFGWHAFVHEGEIEADALLQRVSKRLPRMAAFFIETLTQGERIFVRVPDWMETHADCLALQSALRAYGPGRLLVVRADPARLGEVEEAEGGILVGYIDRYCDTTAVPDTTRAASWLALCRNVRARYPAAPAAEPSDADAAIDHPAAAEDDDGPFADLRPRRIITIHDTVVFRDDAGGALRHGPPASSPANVFLVALRRTAWLLHSTPAGVRPLAVPPDGDAGPEAASAAPFRLVDGEGIRFGLLRDGRLLCAEDDGRVTLSRRKLGPWESFRGLAA